MIGIIVALLCLKLFLFLNSTLMWKLRAISSPTYYTESGAWTQNETEAKLFTNEEREDYMNKYPHLRRFENSLWCPVK